MGLADQFENIRKGDVGIFGDPISHTLSPTLHNAAFQTWWGAFRDRDEPTPVYHAFHVKSMELEEAIRLAKEVGLRGLNITVPHKERVLSFVDHLDHRAKFLGSVNTIVFKSGFAKGYNTDGPGFKRALEWDLGCQLEGKKSLVLGTGGTGRVLIRELLEIEDSQVFVWNRSTQRLTSFMDEVTPRPAGLHPIASAEELKKIVKEADFVVNATSVGLSEKDELPAPHLEFRQGQAVMDVIYHRETSFMRHARESGARVLGGEAMFLHQAALSFGLWVDAPAPLDLMRQVLNNSLKGK